MLFSLGFARYAKVNGKVLGNVWLDLDVVNIKGIVIPSNQGGVFANFGNASHVIKDGEVQVDKNGKPTYNTPGVTLDDEFAGKVHEAINAFWPTNLKRVKLEIKKDGKLAVVKGSVSTVASAIEGAEDLIKAAGLAYPKAAVSEQEEEHPEEHEGSM